MTSKKALIEGAVVTIKGKNPDGDEVEYTADVDNLEIDLQQDDYPYLNTWNSNSFLRPLPRACFFNIRLKRQEGGIFYTTVVTPQRNVERTARVEIDNFTPGALVEAMHKAGVDAETEFTFVTEGSGKTAKHYVEFKWTD